MTKRKQTNVAASVHARLLNRSRQTGEDFNLLLQRYAAERFLYRLGCSDYRNHFVLKGAMLFPLWGGPIYRATRDLDFTGYGDASEEALRQCFAAICTQPVRDDGIVFDVSTIRIEPILDEAEYNGLRVRFEGRLGSARIPMQVDVGFGNAIEPPATDETYPTLLDGPAPRIRAYPVEAVVAEKLHAIHRFGATNSRLKDFYDLYVVSEQFDFDGNRLGQAIAATFERRATPIDTVLPVGLQTHFFADDGRAGQWQAYLSRNGLPGAPSDFQAVGERLRAFFGPIWDALAAGSTCDGRWQAGNGWSLGAASPGLHAALATEATFRRFKPYPAYKDSGVQWLGEIPAHWEVKPLKRALRSGNADGSLIKGHLYQEPEEGLFPGFSASGQDVWVEEAQHHGPGIVLSAVGARCGKTFKADGHWTAVANTHVFFPHAGFDRDFLWYLTNDETFWDRGGTAQPFVRVASTLQRPWCFPPLPEQRAIAAFLDRETAKIDALVAKKERLIELLQEKRTALITRAVTKGLDPTVPMKDSGVEWLGEIPAHWEVRRLKRVVQLEGGGTPARDNLEYWRGEIPWVSPKDMKVSVVVDTEDKITTDAIRESATKLIPSGAVLIVVRSGILAHSIPVAIAGCDLTLNQDLKAMIPRSGLAPEYLAYFITGLQRELLAEWKKEGATVESLELESVTCTPTLLPTVAEQRAIAAFLDRETAKIDALIAKVREAIERLKEYRTALISAAVTGKIDVREAVAA
ncbi:MAG: hypothetical protein KatS3mg007_0212 [Thermoanaerobaculum sp.]|nr:MAG: hypothetical protein KatS3mg007_0212 [Thermoanaerobaculum sp.]